MNIAPKILILAGLALILFSALTRARRAARPRPPAAALLRLAWDLLVVLPVVTIVFAALQFGPWPAAPGARMPQLRTRRGGTR